MKKVFLIIGGIIISLFIGFLILMLIYVLKYSPEAINRNKFENDFDLQLKGQILDTKVNRYGQTLVCLKVIKSNYKNYFPIYNPNEGNEDEDFWKKRFFIKVEDSLAVFICENKSSSSIYEFLHKGAFVVINRNNNKSFEVFKNNQTEKETNIGLKILTYPIRDNIEKSCLMEK
ncbi:hypothetical protein MUU74_15955 [Chryseobacterium daecheongense]|uniref:hypothetical protein n=1 Tax=Chryseobacterium daecheongense TaxID=192389 RepID=UPI001FD7071C|nr:hypothetical protein [Chryseobacterium daecheongense]UOU97975.1 hypothetical protein MUU74_15955 [Chryseobacterium daecheongense]